MQMNIKRRVHPCLRLLGGVRLGQMGEQKGSQRDSSGEGLVRRFAGRWREGRATGQGRSDSPGLRATGEGRGRPQKATSALLPRGLWIL